MKLITAIEAVHDRRRQGCPEQAGIHGLTISESRATADRRAHGGVPSEYAVDFVPKIRSRWWSTTTPWTW